MLMQVVFAIHHSIGEKFSAVPEILCGVPQGSVLGPLFIFWISVVQSDSKSITPVLFRNANLFWIVM